MAREREPFAAQLEEEGAGHVWYAAASRGPATYTTFNAPRAFLEREPENIKVIMDATNTLARLLKIRFDISKEQKKGLKEAIGNVLRDIAIPLGIGIGNALTK